MLYTENFESTSLPVCYSFKLVFVKIRVRKLFIIQQFMMKLSYGYEKKDCSVDDFVN